jgi:hypothetical protein
MTSLEQGVFRTVAALTILGAPPTLPEVVHHYDRGTEQDLPLLEGIRLAADALVDKQKLGLMRGRYVPVSLQTELAPTLTGEEWMPRKLRKTRKIAHWLSRLSGVRAVFLCNRTAFGLPRDEGDLDFLVIVRHGSIWQTRGLAGLPFVLLGDRPRPGEDERDVVCLSFFLSDQALDLSVCALQPDDMYLRHWFLGLLPFVDDGAGKEFWDANAGLRLRHPHAERWIPSPDLQVSLPRLRIPVNSALERVARSLQWKYFPRALRDKANKDTHVMISDHHLKFHVDDGREALQATYKKLCDQYDVAS